MKIIVSIIVNLVIALLMPYTTYIYRGDYYPVSLLGNNKYPLEELEEAMLPYESLFFIGILVVLIIIVYSSLTEKYKMCRISAIINLVLSFVEFYTVLGIAINMESKYLSLMPISSILYIVCAITILIFVNKEYKSL